MLIANKSVANFLKSKSKENSIIFRHHPKSSIEKEKEFESLINIFDFKTEQNTLLFDLLNSFLENFHENKRKLLALAFYIF